VPQVPLAASHTLVQVVDEGQGRGDVADPRLSQRQSSKQLTAAGAEQVADWARLAEGQQGGVDAVLERGPVADQMQPEPARSRSARTPGVGSQISGTRSRRDSSASTQASIGRSYRQAGPGP
jgi:hypothetical protein